ncbi:MAG: hypothetical protein DDG58_02945, partial [Ardenticatenia bacterium]
RAFGVETPLTFQTDWGQEFGGDSPQPVAGRSRRFLQLLGGERRRYPLGREGETTVEWNTVIAPTMRRFIAPICFRHRMCGNS